MLFGSQETDGKMGKPLRGVKVRDGALIPLNCRENWPNEIVYRFRPPLFRFE